MNLSRARRDQLTGAALLTPTLLLFALLILYPMVQSFWLSLHRTSTLTLQSRWTGIGNYVALFTDPAFWTSFLNTLICTASSVALQVVIGVAMALLMHGTFFGRASARGLVLFPYLPPTAVAVLVWRWLFNDLYGFLNFLLLSLGLPEPERRMGAADGGIGADDLAGSDLLLVPAKTSDQRLRCRRGIRT